MIRSLVLLLAACTAPVEPAGTPIAPTPVTDQAAAMALACGTAHRLPVVRPYAALRLHLVDALPTADWGQGNRAYVLTALRQEPRVWAHVFVHLMFNLPGDAETPHPAVFRRCELWPI